MQTRFWSGAVTCEAMSWLDHVQAASEKTPHWLEQVIEHPSFNALHREGTTWLLYTGDGQPLEAEDLREVCKKFSQQFGLPV